MSNDLSRGLFPAKEVKLLIVDEAHKAQGDYAYCQVHIYYPEIQGYILCKNTMVGLMAAGEKWKMKGTKKSKIASEWIKMP